MPAVILAMVAAMKGAGVPGVPAAEAGRSGAAEGSALSAIEIEFSGASRVRIPASVPADLAAVIAALRRR